MTGVDAASGAGVPDGVRRPGAPVDVVPGRASDAAVGGAAVAPRSQSQALPEARALPDAHALPPAQALAEARALPDAHALPPAQALAEATVAALVAGGMRDVVLAPGSRSAPMAYALLDAEQAGALRLHVLVDERSAGFVALGLAVATERPVGVVVTSGSAVVNLHPAVLEAAHQRVPLVVVSCDRPAEMIARGGSQTTEHLGIFGSSRADGGTVDGPAGGISRPRASAEVDSTALAPAAVVDLLAAARGPLAGPVHLNLAFAPPLVPVGVRCLRMVAVGSSEADADAQVTGMGAESAGPQETVRTPPIRRERTPRVGSGARAVILAGDGAPPEAVAAVVGAGWPLLAEPTVSAPERLTATPVLLDALGEQAERVLVLGRPTLSRQQMAMLGRADLDVVILDPPGAAWLDAPGARHITQSPELGAVPIEWCERWRAAAAAIEAELDREVEAARAGGEVAGWVVARVASRAVRADGGLLVAGASMAIRELDLAGVPGAHVVANRGVAGIDGTVSTALGHALARSVGGAAPGPVRALLGDLTLQHDMGGLVRGRLEREVDLQLVVLADDGGSIFATLEHGRPEHAAAHERVFATPQRLDLAALAAAVGARHTLVPDGGALRAALGPPVCGVEIVEVRLRREGAAARRRALHERLVATAREAR